MQDVDDVTLEPEDGEGATSTAAEKLKALREKLKKAEADAAENLAGWQRSKADYVNLGRRMRELEDSFGKAGVVAVIRELLDVFDSIEASAHPTLIKQLDQSLVRLGVTRFRPEPGSVFTPESQEAVQRVETLDEAQDNTIHSVVQSGYAQDGTTIRPARVTVYHHG